MDIKKVLAYSTVSQLGYMFLALGVGAPGAAVFHLVTHAFFKALLFLGAGSVIHGLSGEQDMERMGGLRREMPITFATMTVGVLALAGIWPLSGFFSKDEILWGAFAAGAHPVPMLGVVGLVVALLTAYYSGRLLFLTFFGESRVTEHARHHLHESPAVMTLPLVVLALLSIVGGFIPVPAVVASVVGAEAHGHAAHAPLGFMALALGLAVGGLAIAWVLYGRLPGLPMIFAWRLGWFYRLVRDKFRVDELYAALIVEPLFALARFFAGFLDPRVIDGVANGAAAFVGATAGLWRRAQTGNVQHYALSFLVGALVLLGWYAGQ
jgi:NADH-quinone oxidoreductase subunit L